MNENIYFSVVMEYPWKQFATDYTDKGSNTNAFTPLSSHMCYQPSLQSSYPSYNRSPAPFYSTNPEPSNFQLNPPPRFKVNSFYKKQPLDLQQTSHGESQFITPEQVQEHSQYPQEQWQVGQTHKPEIQQQTSLRPFIQQFENYDHQPIQHQQPSQPITQQYENYCQQQPIQHQQSLQPVTQQYENYYQQQQQQYQQQQPETIVPGNFESGNRVIKNTREDPDIDEDFPSYADLRNVFLRKQRKAEAEQRIANFQKPKVVNKPPLVPQKPLQPVRKHTTAPPAMSPQHSFPQKAQHSFLQFNLSEPKALKPARDFTPTSSPSPNKREFGVGNDQSVKGKTLLNNTTYNGGMMEIPVHHMDDKKPTWHHIKLNRTGVRQRPLSLLEINSNNNYDSSTPRVVITSNSPLSPQKAIYRPDSDQPGDWFDRATPTAYSANTLPSRSSSYSKPRRRASYGEILITRNSPPRSVSLAPGGSIRRAVSQASHSETYPKEDVKYYSDERKYSTLGNYRKHEESFRQHRNTTSSYRSTQSTWSSSSDVGHRYPGTKIRNPTIDQMLYPSTTQNAHCKSCMIIDLHLGA